MISNPRYPELARGLSGPIYLVPQYRQADYLDQRNMLGATYQQLSDLGHINQAIIEKHSAEDTGKHNAEAITKKAKAITIEVFSLLATMHWCSTGKKTLFLERELAQALTRTELLKDLNAGDLRFKYRNFRLYVPLGVISNQKGFSLALIDVCRFGKSELAQLKARPKLSDELNARYSEFLAQVREFEAGTPAGKSDNRLVIQVRSVRCAKDQKCIYNPMLFDLTAQTLTDLAETHNWVDGGEDYEGYISRSLHLTLNVLLFLSVQPLECEPEEILRKAKTIGDHQRPELKRAFFVGRLSYRPRSKSRETHSESAGLAAGRKRLPHYVAGHWKRQVHGVGRTQRPLIWIQPYATSETIITESQPEAV